MKTKEQISAYNKEYFARPYVIVRARIRNAQRRDKRKVYKQTEAGKRAGIKYRQSEKFKTTNERSRIKRLYGITPEIYKEMLEKRGGVCDICKQASSIKLQIDHCHLTKKVRGLLCGSCNMALGLMKDDIIILSNAINYLNNG